MLKQLIENMIYDYLEDDLVESVFEEVSPQTWEAIEEAILNELSPELLKRYINKSIRDQDKRNRLVRDAENRISDREVSNPFGNKDKARRDSRDSKSIERNSRKSYNREVGQDAAFRKLDKRKN